MPRSDRPLPSRARSGPGEVLPVLAWLNRRELASRFPAWQPAPTPLPGREPEPGPAPDDREQGDPR